VAGICGCLSSAAPQFRRRPSFDIYVYNFGLNFMVSGVRGRMTGYGRLKMQNLFIPSGRDARILFICIDNCCIDNYSD
jgi:hypothetical protein